MSWRSARAAYGLDAPCERPNGPHERWSGYAWRVAALGVALLAAAIVAALAVFGLDALVGYRLPYLTGFLRVLGIAAFAALASVVLIMFAGDRLDRRAAWRDDALQDRLPINHYLRRP